MKISKILIFLATISLLGCPVANPEQKVEEFYDFEPIYIKVQNKIDPKMKTIRYWTGAAFDDKSGNAKS